MLQCLTMGGQGIGRGQQPERRRRGRGVRLRGGGVGRQNRGRGRRGRGHMRVPDDPTHPTPHSLTPLRNFSQHGDGKYMIASHIHR